MSVTSDQFAFHRSSWDGSSLLAYRNKNVLPSPTDTFYVAHANVSLRVSHMFSGASLLHCFLFPGIAIFLWAFSGHSGMAMALPSTMFSTETGPPCSTLLPGLCSWFQSCPEVLGKRGENATLFICWAVKKSKALLLVFSELTKCLVNWSLRWTWNWIHQHSHLLHFQAQMPWQRNLASISLDQWSERRNNVHPSQIKAFKDCTQVCHSLPFGQCCAEWSDTEVT